MVGCCCINDPLTVSNSFCIFFLVEQQRLSEVKRDKSQYCSDCNYLEKQIEELKDTLQRSEDEKKDLKKKCIGLSTTEENLRIDVEHAKTRLNSTDHDKREYSTKCRDFEKQVDTLKSTLQVYDKEKKELTKKLNACLMNQEHLKTKLKNVNIQLERAEGEKEQYLKTCDGFTNQRAEFKSRLQGLEDENKDISKRRDELSKEVNDLIADLHYESTQRERTEREKREHSTKCRDLEKRIETYKGTLQKTRDEKKDLEKKYNDCSTNEKNLEIELKCVTDQLERAKRDNSHLLRSCNDLKKRTAELESKLTQGSEDETKENTNLESPSRGKTASGSRKSGTQGRNNR